MSDLPRQSAFLPTIKCSTCGGQIEISMMGDHLCPGPGADVPPVPPSKFPAASYGNSLSDKYDRMPPSLDTNAANGGFMRQGQLTPVSTSSGSRSLSPKTPDSRTVGGRGNDFFEPSIASDSDTTYSQQGRRPGGYGSFSQRDEFDADPPYSSSPNKQQPSLLSRMDNLAPGPFDVRGNAGPMGNASPPRDNPSRLGYGDGRRPSTAASNQPMPNSLSQRAPRKDGYGGMGKQDQFEPEPFSSFNRAGTFPRPNNPADMPARTPSAPGPRAGRQSHLRGKSSYGAGPDTSRPPPPRKSLIPAKGPDRSIDLAAEFGIGNPYHSPTASMSSAITSFTQSSGSSDPNSRSTPPRSNGRNPSNTSSIDDLMNDLQSSMEEMKPLTPQLGRNPSIGSSRRGRSRDGRSAGRDRSASRSRQPGPTQFDQPSFNLKAEVDRYKSSKARDQSRPGYGQGSRPQDRGMSDDDRFGRSLDSSSLDPRPRGFSRERQGSAVSLPSRGACKSCGDEIRGKSISSADGRLTGKYHKACFVCTTCRDPFASAEFYVLNDKPYCELHYHTLNGSLCGACGKGIEGQYLEDENLDKYHVGCFRCGDCSMSLVNGYFDVDGVAYCERDAWRRAQAQQPVYGTSPDGGMLSPAASDYGNLMSPMNPAFNKSNNNNRYGPGPVPPSPGFGRGPPGSFMGGPPKRPGNMGPPGQRRGPPPGLPRGQRMPPGTGPVARPRMNKRNTRLGMM